MRIGFIGKMRSGKDTAAEYLCSKYSDSFIYKFADPLYDIERAIFSIAHVPIPEDKTKRRRLLQFLGTEWGRETIDPDIWINIMAHRLQSARDWENIFVTDVRFPNEVAVLKENGFKIFKIIRPDSEREKFGATHQSHLSETALDTFDEVDGIIENDGNLVNFYEKIDKAIHGTFGFVPRDSRENSLSL